MQTASCKTYTKSRANKKDYKNMEIITTYEDKKWTKNISSRSKRNHFTKVVTLNNKKISEELERADAHPYGARPFERKDYIKKFFTLTDKILSKKESDRFIKTVQILKKLKKGSLNRLNIEVSRKYLKKNKKKGIF